MQVTPSVVEATSTSSRIPRVLLAGNPNVGKTTLFNLLAGLHARVGNYPGVTVEQRSAKMVLRNQQELCVVDLPGTYSLAARSAEEQIAADAILTHDASSAPDVVVVVVDATTLSRSLYLAVQILETGVPVVLAVNMMDQIRASGAHVNVEKLSALLGVEAVSLSASKREGSEALLSAIGRALSSDTQTTPKLPTFPLPVEQKILELEEVVGREYNIRSPQQRKAKALWCLLSLGDDELVRVPIAVRTHTARVRAHAAEQGIDLDLEIIKARYQTIDSIVGSVLRKGESDPRAQTSRIDSLLVHPVSGLLIFSAVMVTVFEALFLWAEPAMRGIEAVVSSVQQTITSVMHPGLLRDVIVNGVLAGVGNVIIFIPQIALLSLFLVLLEDSGYLARVAFVIDRLMSRVGLHGRAFIPLLSGFACAVPAVMATRTIEHRRDRLATMLALPFMSCSARLPVYLMVVAAVFPAGARVGFLSLGSLVLLGLYTLSTCATLVAAALLRKTVLRGETAPFLMELPPYRLPALRTVALSVWERVRSFLVEAGTLIAAFTIVLWALLSFPRSSEVTNHYRIEKERVVRTVPLARRDEAIHEISAHEASEQLAHSMGGQLGKWIEPVLKPLGFDWRLGVGILGAFAAREVFISTLGIVFAVGDADETSQPLRTALQNAKKPDGTKLITPLVGVSLLIFFLFSCQCMSTLAVVRRESGSWKWPLLMFTYMSAVAYLAALFVYQGGHILMRLG